MDNKKADHLLKLETQNIRKNLLRAALYLSAYEVLQHSVIDGVDGFLAYEKEREDWKKEYAKLCAEKGWKAKKYRSAFYRSCYWLIKYGALKEKDLQTLDEINEHRNTVAHELPQFLIDASFEVRADLLIAIGDFVRKVDIWLAKNDVLIELSTGDIADTSGEEAQITSGRMALLQHVINSVVDDL